MTKFSEYVSLGHPDKIADYISQFLLDKYISDDQDARYAVDVQIKGECVTLGGEVSSSVHYSDDEIALCVRDAIKDIGYTTDYQKYWGSENTISGDAIEVTNYISQQSPDIARGLSGWGDQGIFYGFWNNDQIAGLQNEHYLASCRGRVWFSFLRFFCGFFAVFYSNQSPMLRTNVRNCHLLPTPQNP